MKIPLKIVTRLKANKSIGFRLIQLTAQTRRLMEKRKCSLLQPTAVSVAVSQKKTGDKALSLFVFVHVLIGKEPFPS